MRALAYGIIGGVAGAAIALGPLIGGWVTTTFSWRYVFAAETVVVIGILLVRRLMAAAQQAERRPQLDYFGAALSAAGLGVAVFGILKSSEWGWIQPRGAPTIGGTEIKPFGLSVVLFLILIGLCLLGAFWEWEEHRERAGRDTLVDRSLLKIVPLNAGLKTLVMQQLVLLGTFFVLPVYLQVVLGLDAFETGKRLLPMSITMLAAALAGPRLAARLSPKRVVQAGLGGLAIGAFCLVGTIDVKLNTLQFSLSLALFGLGIGLVISQLGNVIMSSVDESKSNEAGGLQGTAQNLGASLGTALIGSVLIAGLTSGFVSRIEDNSQLPQRAKDQIVAVAQQGLDVVPVSEVEKAAKDAGLRSSQAEVVANAYGDAELDGLQNALLAVALLCVVSFWFTRHLPGRAIAAERAEPAPEAVPDQLAAGT
jgi:MFS family permease